MKSLSVRIALMLALLALDQLGKLWVRLEVPLHRTTPLIPNFIDLTHTENPGVSFSLLAGLAAGVRVPLLAGISLVAVAALGWYWLRHRKQMGAFAELALLLILPGAVGNLIDRAWFGVVTDFLHFRIYSTSLFVNNIADIEISAGVVAYLLGTVLEKKARREG